MNCEEISQIVQELFHTRQATMTYQVKCTTVIGSQIKVSFFVQRSAVLDCLNCQLGSPHLSY